MKFSIRLSFAAAMTASILLGACSSTPVVAPLVPTTAPSQASTPATTPAMPKPAAAVPIAPYLDPKSPLHSRRSIYFDFDEFIVKAEYAPVLELHGKYLAEHSNVSIRVQGNTDELGGTEYNLALGQRRAEAVVKALKVYGVKDSQMEAISFGKEKPKAPGHDETAHAQNRRADLAYPEK